MGQGGGMSTIGGSACRSMVPTSGLPTAFAKRTTVPSEGLRLATGRDVIATCQCCKQQCPVGLCVPKGNAWWCLKDNASYQALITRWAKNSKLRVWWQSLDAAAKVSWFMKWQGMDSKNKFDSIDYEDKSIQAIDHIVDEIIKWDNWEEYWLRKKDIPGNTWQSLWINWQQTLEANSTSATFSHGEWWVPRYAGPEMRKRQRTSNEQIVSRHSAIHDPSQLQQLIQTGQNNLQQFQKGITDPNLAACSTQGPEILSRQEDMPQMLEPANTAMDLIAREA